MSVKDREDGKSGGQRQPPSSRVFGRETDTLETMKAAAQVLARHEDWSKARIAGIAKVARSTLYLWLRDPQFLAMVDEYRVSPTVLAADTDDLLQSLSEEQETRLITALEAEANNPDRARIDAILARLLQRVAGVSGTDRRRNSVSELQKAAVRIARLNLNRGDWSGFEQDGTPKEATLRDMKIASAMSDFVANLASMFTDVLTESQLVQARRYRKLAKVYLLDAALQRRGLSVE